MGKTGVLVPTHGRPDLIRFCLLQMMSQTVRPDFVVIHQNGDEESYESIIEDISWPFEKEWIFSPEKLPQHDWYKIPLKRLLELGCDHYFWVDHDDIYNSNHIEVSLGELENNDFRVSSYSQQLTVDKRKYELTPKFRFKSHAPNGQSSSMAFNRNFAECLIEDIEKDTQNKYTDNIVAKITMPKFRCLNSENCTTKYVCHKGCISSWHWVERILG